MDKSRNRSQGGRKAQTQGQMFESLFFRKVTDAQIQITRMPDGCKQLSASIFRVQTPFDWILSYQGKVALIDTKATEGSTFPYSKIKTHQVNELSKHEMSGVIAGYVIWLKELKHIGFVGASYLKSISMKRGSIRLEHPQFKSLGNDQFFDPLLIFR